MVEINECPDEEMAIEDGKDENEQTRSRVFEQLKPYCLELLELLQHPDKHSSAIPSLLQFLRQSPPDSFQPFFE